MVKLSHNKRNTCMTIFGGLRDLRKLETADPGWTHNTHTYTDGDIVACIGRELVRTAHYEKQVHYKILTLKGETAVISKGNRNKYFELVK